MPVTNDDDDDDRDITPAGLKRRLQKVTDILERANARLERIRGGLSEPPQPDRVGLSEPPQPDRGALIAAVNAIKTQATNASKLADELTTRLRH